MVRERAQEVRGHLIGQLEGAAKDLAAILETARESDGDRLRCKACGSFIPGVSKLKLRDPSLTHMGGNRASIRYATTQIFRPWRGPSVSSTARR